MTDITKRLRSGFGGLVPPICDEAANLIDALKAENASLQKQILVTRKYSYGDGYEGASIELYGRIQALEADQKLIAEFIFVDPPFDAYADIDLHEEASINASAFGRDEPNQNDYYAAFLTCAKSAISALQSCGYTTEVQP